MLGPWRWPLSDCSRGTVTGASARPRPRRPESPRGCPPPPQNTSRVHRVARACLSLLPMPMKIREPPGESRLSPRSRQTEGPPGRARRASTAFRSETAAGASHEAPSGTPGATMVGCLTTVDTAGALAGRARTLVLSSLTPTQESGVHAFATSITGGDTRPFVSFSACHLALPSTVARAMPAGRRLAWGRWAQRVWGGASAGTRRVREPAGSPAHGPWGLYPFGYRLYPSGVSGGRGSCA